MFLRKSIAAIFVVLAMCAGVAVAAPLSVEGRTSVLTVPQDQALMGKLGERRSVSVPQVMAVALLGDKSTRDVVENGSVKGFLSKVPLSPALILFAVALGAIGWLGRQRKPGNSNWE